MPATNYAISKELNSEFRSYTSGSYISWPNWYIGVSLSEIDNDGFGVLEPTDRGYRRVAVPRNATYWTAPSDGSLKNATSIVFPQSTRHWGTIKEIFISSSSEVGTSGSYIWFHKKLDQPIAVLDGTKITIPQNAILIDRKE